METGTKLCESLTGESLKVAMSLGILDKLAQKDGVLKLVEALRLHMFPMATAEARELFKAGQRPGILSRQAGEPFISYISRRRRWYELLKQFDPKLEIPNTLRGELLLDHANLTQSEKLMTMTSTFNHLEFDTVAEALVKQHALAHDLLPGMQEQRTHGICPGNLQRHHGIQRRPGMEMTVPGMKGHVKTNMRKWPKTTLMKQRMQSR